MTFKLRLWEQHTFKSYCTATAYGIIDLDSRRSLAWLHGLTQYYIMLCFLCTSDLPFSMTSELDSSLTSIDWLPQLGVSSLRSGKERVERKKERGREKNTPPIPTLSPGSNSKVKPPHSYATLIAMAISSAPEMKLSLNDIYTWISNTFPFYCRAGRGWKVKARPLHDHFLVLNSAPRQGCVCSCARTGPVLWIYTFIDLIN